MVAKSDKKNVSKDNKSCGNQYSVKQKATLRVGDNKVVCNVMVQKLSSVQIFTYLTVTILFNTK